jgi:O-antigen/teichoic acid export membrane protein
VKKQLIKNSWIGFLQYILTAAITLISVPVFIHKLGLELYGIFALVSVIGNLSLITNLGLNSALLVYISKQGKCKESDHDIIVTQIIMAGLMAIFVFLTIIFKEKIVRNLFSIPEQFTVEAEILLIYLIFANSFLLIGQTYVAIIDALQKIYITNISQLVYSTIYWGGMIIAVSLGGGLVSLGMIALTSAIIWFILLTIITRYFWGKINQKGLKDQFIKIACKQISYGSKIYLSGLVGFMFEPLSKILLSNFIGVHAVALFEIGLKIKTQINGIISKVIYPFFPFIANSPNNESLKSKVFDLSKKIQLIVIPVSITFGFVLTILIKLWLGDVNLEKTSAFVIILTIAVLLFSAPILPVYHYLAAKNMADKNIWIQFSSVIVNIIVFYSFYKIIGLYTILISNILAYLTSYILGNYYQYRYLGARFNKEWAYNLKLLTFGIACTSICLAIRYFRPVGLLDLIIYPSVVVVLFTFFIRWLKMISYHDLQQYFGTIPVVQNSLARILIK